MSDASSAVFGVVVAGGNGRGSNVNQLCFPFSVQYNSGSSSLFISNYACHTIARWVIGAPTWTLVAGTNGLSGISSTLLNFPSSIYLDYMGNVYVADTLNHRIQLFLNGQENGTTIAGCAGITGSNMSLLNVPLGILLDRQMNLYVSDTGNSRVLTFIRYWLQTYGCFFLNSLFSFLGLFFSQRRWMSKLNINHAIKYRCKQRTFSHWSKNNVQVVRYSFADDMTRSTFEECKSRTVEE